MCVDPIAGGPPAAGARLGTRATGAAGGAQGTRLRGALRELLAERQVRRLRRQPVRSRALPLRRVALARCITETLQSPLLTP